MPEFQLMEELCDGKPVGPALLGAALPRKSGGCGGRGAVLAAGEPGAPRGLRCPELRVGSVSEGLPSARPHA